MQYEYVYTLHDIYVRTAVYDNTRSNFILQVRILMSKPTSTKYNMSLGINSSHLWVSVLEWEHAVLRQQLYSSMPAKQGIGTSSDKIERDEYPLLPVRGFSLL